MVVLDANLFRRVGCLNRSCGFSIQVRNGTCCHKAIQTTKRYIGASRPGVVMKFYDVC